MEPYSGMCSLHSSGASGQIFDTVRFRTAYGNIPAYKFVQGREFGGSSVYQFQNILRPFPQQSPFVCQPYIIISPYKQLLS